MSPSFSFCWHFLLRSRSFVFGTSQPRRPPVYLLLGLQRNRRGLMLSKGEVAGSLSPPLTDWPASLRHYWAERWMTWKVLPPWRCCSSPCSYCTVSPLGFPFSTWRKSSSYTQHNTVSNQAAFFFLFQENDADVRRKLEEDARFTLKMLTTTH